MSCKVIISAFLAACQVRLGVSAIFSEDQYKDLRVLGEDRCTTIAVGPKATVDGSTMCTDTMDCADCDWRMGKVPAKDHPEGSMRPVYAESSQYPRYIRNDRGPTWTEENLETNPSGLRDLWINEPTEILGYIPQVPHTYAIVEGQYGFMNEYQVAMGESTCAAKLFAGPLGWKDGKALLNIGELMQIGLERSKTAREAIQVMGDVATTYGFYGESYDPGTYGPAYVLGEAGEGLSVIDPKEAWIFHILPDDTGSSAVWVAQRVPDNHVSVVANSFVIRDILPDSDEFMYSDNIFEVAKRSGLWNPKKNKLLDFKTVYSPERYHPSYSNNRVWRVFSLANPSADLTMFTDADGDDYPFSFPVDHLLSLHDVIAFNRDQYESIEFFSIARISHSLLLVGTPLSLTDGLAAGPFGDPNRYQNNAYGSMTIWDTLEGSFPRAISLFRTSTSIVAQSRSDVPNILGRVWVSAYAPDMSSYSPVYVASKRLSKHWTSGSMHAYDPEVAWWNFAVVGNYVARYYHFAVASVRELQQRLQLSLDQQCIENEEKALIMLKAGEHNENISDMLTEFTVSKGDEISNAWKELFPSILATYRDGYVVTERSSSKNVKLTAMFYPEWWLKTVGYFDDKPNPDPQAILFAPKPNQNFVMSAEGVSIGSLFFGCFLCSVFFGLFGYKLAARQWNEKSGNVPAETEGLINTNCDRYQRQKHTYSSIDSSSP